MDAAIKEQWIKDLRSGEFEQGRGQLEKGGKFCCLGVLAFRAAEAGVIERRESQFPGSAAWYDESKGVLTPEICKWAGLEEDNDKGTYVLEDGTIRHLTQDNDYNGHNFVMIADTIENYF